MSGRRGGPLGTGGKSDEKASWLRSTSYTSWCLSSSQLYASSAVPSARTNGIRATSGECSRHARYAGYGFSQVAGLKKSSTTTGSPELIASSIAPFRLEKHRIGAAVRLGPNPNGRDAKLD